MENHTDLRCNLSVSSLIFPRGEHSLSLRALPGRGTASPSKINICLTLGPYDASALSEVCSNCKGPDAGCLCHGVFARRITLGNSGEDGYLRRKRQFPHFSLHIMHCLRVCKHCLIFKWRRSRPISPDKGLGICIITETDYHVARQFTMICLFPAMAP